MHFLILVGIESGNARLVRGPVLMGYLGQFEDSRDMES